MALWSNAGHWTEQVRSAGLEVRSDPRADGGKGPPYVWVGEGSRPLALGLTVKLVHGGRMSGITQRWSKLLHSDPGLLGPRSTLRVGETGVHIGSQAREDEHLELALNVAALLRTAGERQASYWGRSGEDLVNACERATASVTGVLPEITAYVEARQTLLFEL